MAAGRGHRQSHPRWDPGCERGEVRLGRAGARRHRVGGGANPTALALRPHSNRLARLGPHHPRGHPRGLPAGVRPRIAHHGHRGRHLLCGHDALRLDRRIRWPGSAGELPLGRGLQRVVLCDHDGGVRLRNKPRVRPLRGHWLYGAHLLRVRSRHVEVRAAGQVGDAVPHVLWMHHGRRVRLARDRLVGDSACSPSP